ncbi:MAG: MFS transporter [Bryobacterales bacterium]|nr:MFS transporter [Bryobacterales bacterium]MBV9399499.1 MFS transporter [Bryobacterales bacterium]
MAALARRWPVVALLFTASLINYLDRASLSLALPAISTELHLDAARKGILLSSFFWSYAFMQIPIGLAIDRFPIRWFYAGMFALWSLACGLTGLVSSLAAFLALRIVLGIGESIYYPGGTKIVALLFKPPDRGLPSGIFNSGTRAGIVVGGIVLPWMIVSFGWRSMFAGVGFGSLLWLLPWLLLVPGSLRPDRAAVASPFGLPPFSRNLLGLCLGFFSFDYFLYLLLTWLPDYLVQVRHLSLMKAGFYSAMPFVVFTLGEAFGGWIGDCLIRRGHDETRSRKWIVTAALLSGLLLIPAVAVENARLAIGLIIGACCAGLAMGNLIVMVQNIAPPQEVAVWAGLQNFAGNVGGILAPLVTGFLIARTGSYMPGFVIAALILAAGLLPYWLLVGELKPVYQPQ